MIISKKRISTFLILIGGMLFLFFIPDSTNGSYGVYSLVPPLIAIVFALYTREVLSSLFLAILCGGIISGKYNVVQEFLIPSVATENYAVILIVYLWALGGLIGVWSKTGGAETFGIWASKKMVRGPRSAKFFTWCMGLVFHQGGTISTVLTGATVRPVTDSNKVSHEELSFIVDSTASPVATIIPFNIWPFYVSGLVVGTIPLFQSEMDGVRFFFSSIPFNFYALFVVIITLFFSLEVLPWYPGKKMKKAIIRAREGRGLDDFNAQPMLAKELTEKNVPEGYRSSLLDFFLPIGTLLGVVIIPFFVSFFIFGEKEQPPLLISEAFLSSVLIAMGLAMYKGMSLQDVISGFIEGCKGVTIGGVILALAISLKEVTVTLGAADYVASLVGTSIPPWTLPGALLLICMVIAFATGTSWGTYAVVFPIAMPLAWVILPDPFFIKLCFASVVGGAVFGDHCSPISDTTILSALATGCDLIDHVTTQLPIAFFTVGAALIVYTVIGIVAF